MLANLAFLFFKYAVRELDEASDSGVVASREGDATAVLSAFRLEGNVFVESDVDGVASPPEDAA